MLKQQLVSAGNAPTVLPDWDADSATHPCTWTGITCRPPTSPADITDTPTAAFVSALSLAHLGLSHGLPPAVALLSRLESLDACGNGFTGTIPVTWSALHSLTELSVAGNALTGPLPVAVLLGMPALQKV